MHKHILCKSTVNHFYVTQTREINTNVHSNDCFNEPLDPVNKILFQTILKNTFKTIDFSP